jgi:hypothetical protein
MVAMVEFRRIRFEKSQKRIGEPHQISRPGRAMGPGAVGAKNKPAGSGEPAGNFSVQLMD